MSKFTRNCDKFKNKSNEDDCLNAVDENSCLCESFNKETTINKNTKIIIVGTLTPQAGRERGYFYCSPAPSQYQYRLIDYATGDLNYSLEEKRQKLKSGKDEIVVDEIKKILKERKVAFLDVIQYAITKNGSPLDDDIVLFNLDYDAFKDINFKKVKFIANSNNAFYGLKIILDKLGIDENDRNIVLIHQSPRAAKMKYVVLREKWKDAFCKI